MGLGSAPFHDLQAFEADEPFISTVGWVWLGGRCGQVELRFLVTVVVSVPRNVRVLPLVVAEEHREQENVDGQYYRNVNACKGKLNVVKVKSQLCFHKSY